MSGPMPRTKNASLVGCHSCYGDTGDDRRAARQKGLSQVGPPLLASGPSRGFVLMRSEGSRVKRGTLSEKRLCPRERKEPPGPRPLERSPPLGLSKMVSTETNDIGFEPEGHPNATPPPKLAELSAIVEKMTVSIPESEIPPPTVNVSEPGLVELPLMVELVTVRLPWFAIPPPKPP